MASVWWPEAKFYMSAGQYKSAPVDALSGQLKITNNLALYCIFLNSTHCGMPADWDGVHVKMMFDYLQGYLTLFNISSVVHHMVWIVTSGSFSLKGSGSQVWIVGLEHMWARSLIQTLYFDSQPYVCMCISSMV